MGFSGARHPFRDRPERAALLAQLERKLAARLNALRSELCLRPNHSICGVSQIAIGADTAFARACRSAGVPQRFFLPQKRDDFLNTADFDAGDRAEALALLNGANVLEERVVSDSADRVQRFRDTVREILRASDLLICVFAGRASTTPTDRGGTADLLRQAIQCGKPVLECHLSVDGVELIVSEVAHHFDRFCTTAAT